MGIEQVVLSVIGALIIWILGEFLNYIKKQKAFGVLKHKKEVVELAVKSVQQLFGILKGQEKFDAARDMVIEYGKSVGLKFTDKEIELMIEATVKELKIKIQETWEE